MIDLDLIIKLRKKSKTYKRVRDKNSKLTE
jgi:hypothetical protein